MARAFKWISVGLGGLFALLGVAALAFYLIGHARLNRWYELPQGLTEVPHDSATLARGEHLLRIHGCQGCHGDSLGGQLFLDIPPGRFVAPNLTSGRGGVGQTWQVEDWDHAIRYGLRPDHISLILVMPYRLFNHLSDVDAAALIAYVKSQPAVDNQLPASRVRLPGYALVTLSDMKDIRGRLSRPPAVSPPPGTAAYGAYLASTICVECHGENLQGGKHPAPDAPPGPSLVPASYWPPAAFAATVRTGIAPDGRQLSEWMPAPRLKYLTDDEIQSLQAYLRTLQPVAATH
jgi:mono/diheme cytochrome c family protein